jgi:FimV-like protein
MIYDNPQSLLLPINNIFAHTIFSVFLTIICVLILISIYSEHHLSNDYNINGDEYNFMASEESEQARLDLAHVFIDIDQNVDAKTILNELLKSKNPITRENAKQLLRTIEVL